MKFLIDLGELPELTRLQIIATTSNKNLIKYYSESQCLEERFSVAQNTNTSISILKKLLNDSDIRVTITVTKNPSWKKYCQSK